MNELRCEMCGSNEIIKQDGLYVCQACNTKYSVEEARKMMTGEVVEVEGTVKIDDSSHLSNLYEIARRAIKTENYIDALRYYNQILIKSPNDWEAQFYVLFCKSLTCNFNDAEYLINSFSNSINVIVGFVKDVPENKQEDIINEILFKSIYMCDSLLEKIKKYYWSIQNPKKRAIYRDKYSDNLSSIAYSIFNLGDALMETFDGEYPAYSVRCWIKGIDISRENSNYIKDKNLKKLELDYKNKIIQYQPDYKPKSKGGYVATSVYGTYDCPEVWTLRRFRDNTLDNNILGKLFIRTYYATSPTIVKFFSDKSGSIGFLNIF